MEKIKNSGMFGEFANKITGPTSFILENKDRRIDVSDDIQYQTTYNVGPMGGKKSIKSKRKAQRLARKITRRK